jgi:hypothetical protein
MRMAAPSDPTQAAHTKQATNLTASAKKPLMSLLHTSSVKVQPNRESLPFVHDPVSLFMAERVRGVLQVNH